MEVTATLLKVASRTSQVLRSERMVGSSCYDTDNARHVLTATIGLLIYIPGFSEEGILLALAGGSNETFVSARQVMDLTHAQD